MRKKNIYKSAVWGLVEEIITIICGLILPRMILLHFGSEYNGITAAIVQFIGCIALLKSGIGMTTKAALYEPLHNHDINRTSCIMAATMKFLRKVAILFVLGLIIFACIYPFCISENFSWSFVFSLALIIGLGTFFQYYFGLGNQLLLEADQKYYIISIISIVNVVFNTVISVVCMELNMTIHMVKLFSSVVYCSTPIILFFYVQKIYRLDRKAEPDWNSISKRWDAFGMQMANFINSNTDIIVASLFLNMKEVSVYTIYFLAINGVKKIALRITAGVESAFGSMVAEKNHSKLKDNFQIFEFILNFVCVIMFSCLIILIVPFVNIYTMGITDVNYSRYLFAIVACLAEMFFCLRLAYTYIVQATGAFAETKKYYFIEAAINILVSVILVHFLGLVGIVGGTLIAMLYRTITFAYYVYKNVIVIEWKSFWYRMIITMINVVMNCIVGVQITRYLPSANYAELVIVAILVVVIITIITSLVHLICCYNLFVKVINIFKGRISNEKDRNCNTV